MIRLVFFTVGLLIFASHAVQAKVACDLRKPVKINVSHVQDPVAYDFTKNSLELDRLGKTAYSPYGSEHKTYKRGLTVGRQYLDTNLQFDYQTLGNDVTCMQVSDINIVMRYNQTVYVSNEYPEGSPIFNNVLEHENVHVRITNSMVDEYAGKLKRALRTAAQSKFHQVGQHEQLEALLRARVDQVVKQVMKEMYVAAQKKHNAFDDDELEDVRAYKRDVAKELEKIFKLNE